MGEYTKGDWAVNPYGNGNFYIIAEKERGMGGRQVATIHYYDVDRSDKIARANAHLIAAAPDMYEACLLGKKLAEELLRITGLSTIYHLDIAKVKRQIEQALAKADGES